MDTSTTQIPESEFERLLAAASRAPRNLQVQPERKELGPSKLNPVRSQNGLPDSPEE